MPLHKELAGPLSHLPDKVGNTLRRLEESPRVTRAVALVDSGVLFMTDRHYVSSNPATAIVRRPLVMGLWVILALAFVILIWGMFAPIDSAAVAQGRVVLFSDKKTIQHLEGGIIKEILVKEGDAVKAGQPLIKLNSTAAAANVSVLQSQYDMSRATRARLIAERDHQDTVTFDADMVARAKTNPDLSKAMAAQERLFSSERDAENAKRAILNQRIAQSQEEIEGLRSQIDSANGQLDLVSNEIATMQRLLAQGLATRTHLMELQRHQNELQGNRGQYEAEIAKAQQNIAETQMQIINQDNEFDAKNAQDLRDAQGQIADTQDKLRAAHDVLSRTTIVAPTSGIVTGLKYHTAGGVIDPGAPIMDIVPQNDTLIVEARVRPNDIGVVHVGEKARLIFPAYRTRATPKVPGRVIQVSADTFTDEHAMPPVTYYLARIQVDKKFLKKLSRPVTLYPGMPADVLITTGSRSFLNYLFKPISESMSRAFREE
jgi:HlyD family type I secretion membrane fusion protein